MDGDHTGKVFMTGRSQAVRLPKAVRFDCEEVSIERDGERLILTPRRKQQRIKSWAEFVKYAPRLSDDFEIPKDLPESLRTYKF